MARRSDKAAEKLQAPPAKKRSREQVTEQSIDKRPKRRKPASDSHLGEKSDKTSNDKPSSVSGPSALEENLDENILSDYVEDNSNNVENDTTDKQACEQTCQDDPEAIENEDNVEAGVKAKEQTKQFNDWFHHCGENDQLAYLSVEDRDRRMKECGARFASILDRLVVRAQRIKKQDIDDGNIRDDIPMTFAWWVSVGAMRSEVILDRLMASLPNAVKVILDCPLNSEELLLLPSKWDGCKLWDIYTDITGKSKDDDLSHPT